MTGRYQVMPALARKQLDDLRASIEQHGVLYAIKVTPDGEIIDGHTRKQIADKLGVPCPQDELAGYTDDELLAMTISLNLDRRHLTSDERAELHRKLRIEFKKSTREIAKMTGVHHSTVAKDLNSVVGNPTTESEPLPETVTGQSGKSYPARRPAKPPPVNKQRAAERAKEDAIAVSVRALNSGMVVAGRRTPRVVAATDRLAAALNDAAIAIGRAMNDKDLDVEFMRAQKELHKDAQIENIRLDLRRRIDALGNKLKELQAEAAKTSPTLEESADRQ